MILRRAAVACAAAALLAVSWPAGADGPEGSSATYNREIVRIFARRCVACHSAGDEIPLDTYTAARPWARAIREEVLERRMPPWPAAHGVRPLANDLFLTPREIATIVAWADGGTPRGDPADLPARADADPWRAGRPSRRVAVRGPGTPVPGRDDVRRLAVPVRLGAGAWVRGFDFRPADRGARAAFLFARVDGAAGERWLGGWTPWHAMTAGPDGAAFEVPAGASLVLEVHGGGDPARGGELGLYLESRPPARATSVEVVASIDRGAPRLRGEAAVDEDLSLWALRPWVEGGDGPVEVAVVGPDGAVEPLLWLAGGTRVWPAPYVLRAPALVRRGSRVRFTAHGSAAGAPRRAGVTLAVYAPAAGTAAAGVTTAPPPRR